MGNQEKVYMLVVLGLPVVYLARLSGAYLYLPFVPLCILLILCRTLGLSSRWAVAVKSLFLAYLGLYVVIAGRYVTLASLYVSGSSRYEPVMAHIHQISEKARLANGVVGYSKARFPSFVVFGGPGRELVSVRANADDSARLWYEANRGRRIEYIIFTQEGQSEGAPPQFIDDKKFQLVDNHSSNQKAKIGRFKLGGYMPGYGYAIYRRAAP